jgi:hypothetical protein
LKKQNQKEGDDEVKDEMPDHDNEVKAKSYEIVEERKYNSIG